MLFTALYSLVVHSLCFCFGLVYAFLNRSVEVSVTPFARIVTQNNYPVETHTVQTRDGYVLTVFRIPGGKNRKVEEIQRNQRRPVVLLWHGLLDSAFTWIVNGPNRSLAYIFAERGYDVWLANNRGNSYSRRHAYLDVNSEEFWQFSWDDMAQFDVPDTVNYILSCTDASRLAYVGHSEGTTQLFAALAIDPSLEKSLNCFVGLGPVMTVRHITSPFLRMAAFLRLDRVLYFLGVKKSFMSVSSGSFMRVVLGLFCAFFPVEVDDILGLLCGKARSRFSKKAGMLWGEHEPGGTSMRNLQHWVQMINGGREPLERTFCKFDYGRAGNMEVYGAPCPPPYAVDRIPPSLPIVLYAGTRDQLVDRHDLGCLVTTLAKHRCRGAAGAVLGTDLAASVVMPPSTPMGPQSHAASAVAHFECRFLADYNHTDYLWDDSADVGFYPKLVQFVDESA